jgi:hypothetical protein
MEREQLFDILFVCRILEFEMVCLILSVGKHDAGRTQFKKVEL